MAGIREAIKSGIHGEHRRYAAVQRRDLSAGVVFRYRSVLACPKGGCGTFLNEIRPYAMRKADTGDTREYKSSPIPKRELFISPHTQGGSWSGVFPLTNVRQKS
jgi:hypothetical protein